MQLQAPHMSERQSLSSSKTPIQVVERVGYPQQGKMVKKTNYLLSLYLEPLHHSPANSLSPVLLPDHQTQAKDVVGPPAFAVGRPGCQKVTSFIVSHNLRKK